MPLGGDPHGRRGAGDRGLRHPLPGGQTAAENLRKQGIKAGVFRPITVWPYPYRRLREIASLPSTKVFLDVEMSLGQMLDDVKLAVAERKPVKFYGRCGGAIPHVSEVEQAAAEAWKEVK